MATPLGCITMEATSFISVNAADAAILGLIEVITITSKSGKQFNVFKANGLGGFTKLLPGVYNSLEAVVSVVQRPQEKWYTRDNGSVISCDLVLWSATPAEPVKGSILEAVSKINKAAQATLEESSTTVELPAD